MLPAAHAVRTAWSRLGTPPVERVVGPLDVFHFSDWMYPPQRGGLRSTMVHDLVPLHFPDWVHRRTARMHGAKYRHAARSCDVVIANSAFTAADVAETLGVPRERIHVAHPGVEASFAPDGSGRDLGRPYALTVATLEPRKNLGTLVEAYRRLDPDELALAVAGAAGWGEQPALDAPGVAAARLHAARGAAGALPRRERLRLSVALRGLRDARRRGDGLRRARASSPRTPRSTRPAATRPCASTRTIPTRSPTGSGSALAERDELVPRGLEHARRFTWRANGEAHLRAWGAS